MAERDGIQAVSGSSGTISLQLGNRNGILGILRDRGKMQ